MNKEHPKAQIPDNPHAQARYTSAKKHAEAAKKAGKTSEEIHALFKRIMSHDAGDIGSIPEDAAHSKYRSAAVHAQKAKAQGKSPQQVHEIFTNIRNGKSAGHK